MTGVVARRTPTAGRRRPRTGALPLLRMSTPHTFPVQARLRRSSEFRKVKEQGRSAAGRWIVVGALCTGAPVRARVGIITTRRCGGAVERNRVRRRLREIVRRARPDLVDGLWMVIVARVGAAAADSRALAAEWLLLARRLSIFKVFGKDP